MTITIPETPTAATVTLPSLPQIAFPDIPSVSITEPTLTDPTGSLREYSYKRYAAAINTLLENRIEDLLEWQGDDTLFNAETAKLQDQIMTELVDIHNKLLSGSAARGFKHVPGTVKNDILDSELAARAKLQDGAVNIQGEMSEKALEFISWAADAGASVVKIGIDDNKNIVYANMAAVQAVVDNLIRFRAEQSKVLDSKIRLYDDELSAVDTNLLVNDSKVLEYDSKVDLARQGISSTELEYEKQHAANLGTIINNAEHLLTAEECLNTADLERAKVLQTHAILNKFLANIKQSHAALVENRAENEVIKSDLEYYKKEAKIAEQEARHILSKFSNAEKELSQLHQLANAEFSLARTEINRYEIGLDADRDRARKITEGYRKTLQESLINKENTDLDTLSNNDISISNWMTEYEAKYRKKVAAADTDAKINRVRIDAYKQAMDDVIKGLATCTRAEWEASQATTLDLTQNISS